MIVTAMAVHSATLARRKRGHSDSGIMCRGSSSPRVILVFVKPVNSDRQKHTCAVMFSQVLLKSSPILLGTNRQASHCSSRCDRRLAAATTLQGLSRSTCFLHLPQLWQEPSVLDHPLRTNEWNSLDSPAEDVVLVAHLHVQLYVPLLGYSIVSLGLNLEKAAFAHSVPDGSLGGQARALAHLAHFPPSHVTWTSSDLGKFARWCDDCDHCPDDWKCLTQNQLQEETEDEMSQVAVSTLRSCLPPLELHGGRSASDGGIPSRSTKV